MVASGLNAKTEQYQANIDVARRNAEQSENNLKTAQKNLEDAEVVKTNAEHVSRIADNYLKLLSDKETETPGSVDPDTLAKAQADKEKADAEKNAAIKKVSNLATELKPVDSKAKEDRDRVKDALNENEPKIKITQLAQGIVADLIRIELTRFSERRKTELASYESAIEVLGGD